MTCRAGQWASPGLAAAVLKLKWHFLSEAFRQTALFCPFTCNLRDTQTPIAKNKSGHLKHTAVIEETDSGFNTGGRFMVRTCQLIEISLKMRNRFLRHLRGGRTKGTAQSPKLCAEFIFHLSRNICLCYLASVQRKRIGYRPFQLPANDETLHRQRTELEFGSYHYPVNSLSPCHKGLVYGAYVKYIIGKKNILALLTQESGKNTLAVILSAHLF